MQVNVPQSIKQQVIDKLAAGIELAKAHYNLATLPMPNISYDLTGRVAGTANYRKWEVTFNSALLMMNLDSFINRTVPHELAHLIVDRVYPESHRGKGFKMTSTGRFKREKRELHGPRFREVMYVLGCDDATRCHTYDTSMVSNRKATFTYRCVSCSKEFQLGPKRHASLQRNERAYWCRCRGTIKLVSAAAPGIRQTTVQIVVPQTQETITVTHHSGSKWDVCVALFKRHNSLSRQSIIKLFVDEAKCTPAGAATYYAKCKSLYT